MGRRWPVGVAVAGLVLAGVAVALGERSGERRGETYAAMDRPPLMLPTDPPVVHGHSLVGPASGAGGVPVPRVPLTLPQGPFDPAGLGVAQAAALAVEVPTGGFQAAFDRAAGVATAAGGLVVSSTSSTSSSTSSSSWVRSGEGRASTGQLLLRVPADRFDSTRRELAGLGRLEGQLTRAEEVTRQIAEQTARLRALDPEDPRNRAQVEQLQTQIKRLEEAAKVATISVQLSEPGVWADAGRRTGLRWRAEQAVAGAVAVLGGMLVVAGWTLPIALLVGVAVLVVRWRRRVGSAA